MLASQILRKEWIARTKKKKNQRIRVFLLCQGTRLPSLQLCDSFATKNPTNSPLLTVFKPPYTLRFPSFPNWLFALLEYTSNTGCWGPWSLTSSVLSVLLREASTCIEHMKQISAFLSFLSLYFIFHCAREITFEHVSIFNIFAVSAKFLNMTVSVMFRSNSNACHESTFQHLLEGNNFQVENVNFKWAKLHK